MAFVSPDRSTSNDCAQGKIQAFASRPESARDRPAAILIAGLVTGNSSILLAAFVEHCVSLVLGHTLDFSWLDVSQTDVFHCSPSLDVSQQRSAADLPVTVSSSEAQRILIQKSLTPQVLVVVSPAGLHLRATVPLLLQRLAERQNDIHPLDQAR
jgi:hypothetical protein